MLNPGYDLTKKWPNVPACYAWLSLDRRGNWRLQGERVTHRGLIEFMNRYYSADDSGRWFVQNGPQRVYVDLACTPWIFRREGAGFVSHTGALAGRILAVLLDADGSILLESELGIGLLDDRDLAGFLADCQLTDGRPADEAAFAELMDNGVAAISWHGLPLTMTAAVDLPERYQFKLQPRG